MQRTDLDTLERAGTFKVKPNDDVADTEVTQAPSILRPQAEAFEAVLSTGALAGHDIWSPYGPAPVRRSALPKAKPANKTRAQRAVQAAATARTTGEGVPSKAAARSVRPDTTYEERLWLPTRLWEALEEVGGASPQGRGDAMLALWEHSTPEIYAHHTDDDGRVLEGTARPPNVIPLAALSPLAGKIPGAPGHGADALLSELVRQEVRELSEHCGLSTKVLQWKAALAVRKKLTDGPTLSLAKPDAIPLATWPAWLERDNALLPLSDDKPMSEDEVRQLLHLMQTESPTAPTEVAQRFIARCDPERLSLFALAVYACWRRDVLMASLDAGLGTPDEDWAQMARRRRLTEEELADVCIPQLKLVDDELELIWGTGRWRVRFDERLAPYYVDARGKRRKSLPKDSGEPPSTTSRWSTWCRRCSARTRLGSPRARPPRARDRHASLLVLDGSLPYIQPRSAELALGAAYLSDGTWGEQDPAAVSELIRLVDQLVAPPKRKGRRPS